MAQKKAALALGQRSKKKSMCFILLQSADLYQCAYFITINQFFQV